MSENDAANDIIDLSEEGDDTDGLENQEDAGDANEGNSGEAGGQTSDAGEAQGGAGEEAVRPELKIVIRVDDKVTVGIQRKETYPVFYTLEEASLDPLGETIKGLITRADSQWSERPQLNKYEATKGKATPKATASAGRASKPRQQARTQNGPTLL